MSVPAAQWMYGEKAEIAESRGWSIDEQRRHIDAVERWNNALGDPVAEDDMATTHPFNYLTEEEAEA